MLTFSIWGNEFSGLKSHRLSHKRSVPGALVRSVFPEINDHSNDKFSSRCLLPVQAQMWQKGALCLFILTHWLLWSHDFLKQEKLVKMIHSLYLFHFKVILETRKLHPVQRQKGTNIQKWESSSQSIKRQLRFWVSSFRE